MSHSGSRAWMLALVIVVALAQHQALARMPREVVQPNLAASLGGPTSPHMRLAHAWWTAAGENEQQHASSATLGERRSYPSPVRSIDRRVANATCADQFDLQNGTHKSGRGGDMRDVAFLTSAERSEIWRILSDPANRTSVSTGLNVGEKVPNTIHLLSFMDELRKRIPAIWPCSYALLHGQVLIVGPRSKTIVAIVAENGSRGTLSEDR
jgi:hypothetical protein